MLSITLVNFALIVVSVIMITRSIRAQNNGTVLVDNECKIPCSNDTTCRLNANCGDKWFCINLECMYQNPEPEPKKELPKCADIGDKCDYDYDCDWGNRAKLHCPWYICNQTINKCFFIG